MSFWIHPPAPAEQGIDHTGNLCTESIYKHSVLGLCMSIYTHTMQELHGGKQQCIWGPSEKSHEHKSLPEMQGVLGASPPPPLARAPDLVLLGTSCTPTPLPKTSVQNFSAAKTTWQVTLNLCTPCTVHVCSCASSLQVSSTALQRVLLRVISHCLTIPFTLLSADTL